MAEKQRLETYHEGWLEYKQRGTKGSTPVYIIHWIVVEKGKLSTFQNDDEMKSRNPIESLSLDQNTTMERMGGLKGWRIKLTRGSSRFAFKCPNKYDRDKWCESISAAIVTQLTKPKSKSMSSIPDQVSSNRPSRPSSHSESENTNNRSLPALPYESQPFSNTSAPSWFFKDCTRATAHTILTLGITYGNVLMIRESTTNRLSYVIVIKEETESGGRFRHWEIIKDGECMYRLNLSDVKHGPFSSLAEVMTFLTDDYLYDFRPMSTNDRSLIGLKEPEYQRYLNRPAQIEEEPEYDIIDDGYVDMSGKQKNSGENAHTLPLPDESTDPNLDEPENRSGSENNWSNTALLLSSIIGLGVGSYLFGGTFIIICLLAAVLLNQR